jgi:hypothetical protein
MISIRIAMATAVRVDDPACRASSSRPHPRGIAEVASLRFTSLLVRRFCLTSSRIECHKASRISSRETPSTRAHS